MRDNLKYTLMIAGMVISWSIYYAVSKVMVNATGSALLAETAPSPPARHF